MRPPLFAKTPYLCYSILVISLYYMGVPRAHSTRGQKGRRRSHLAMKVTKLGVCSHCKKPILPHIMCVHCGFYNNMAVVDIVGRELRKKEKRIQASR